MSALLSILQQFPNCRVTVSSGTYRRRPRVGDRRWTKKHGWQIRRQAVWDGKSVYHRGRAVLEWTREKGLPSEELRSLRFIAANNGAKDLTSKASRAVLAARQQRATSTPTP